MKFESVIGVILFLLSAPFAVAVPITIVNPGFEADVLADGAFKQDPTLGWYGGALVLNPTATDFPDEAPEGENVAWLIGNMGQVLSSNLEANTQYTLTMFVGHRTGDSGSANWTVSLLAGGAVLAVDRDSDPEYAHLPRLPEDPSHPPAAGEWLLSTVSYFASPTDPHLGQPLEIRMLEYTDGLPTFDDVRLDATVVEATAVPEPSTWALLAGGLLGLGILRWRTGLRSGAYESLRGRRQ